MKAITNMEAREYNKAVDILASFIDAKGSTKISNAIRILKKIQSKIKKDERNRKNRSSR